eukprot:g3119.t1
MVTMTARKILLLPLLLLWVMVPVASAPLATEKDGQEQGKVPIMLRCGSPAQHHNISVGKPSLADLKEVVHRLCPGIGDFALAYLDEDGDLMELSRDDILDGARERLEVFTICGENGQSCVARGPQIMQVPLKYPLDGGIYGWASGKAATAVPFEIAQSSWKEGYQACFVVVHTGIAKTQCSKEEKGFIVLRQVGFHRITVSILDSSGDGVHALTPATVSIRLLDTAHGSVFKARIPKLAARAVPLSDDEFFIDKVYVVSLAKRKALRENMLREIKEKAPTLWQLAPEHFEAVDGSKLDLAELAARGMITEEAKRSAESTVPVEAIQSTRGSIGCALSHVELWRGIAARNSSRHTLIFEDDPLLHTNVERRLWALSKTLSDVEFSMLYLGTQHYALRRPFRAEVSHVLGDHYGTFAYAISAQGAAQLLSSAFPISMQIDSYIISQTQSAPHLSVLMADPSLVSELKSTHESDIQRV